MEPEPPPTPPDNADQLRRMERALEILNRLQELVGPLTEAAEMSDAESALEQPDKP